MVNLRTKILSARKPIKAGSIAPLGNTPFGIYDKKKKSKVAHPPIKQAHTWADGLLRSMAGRQERVVLAVRDAARQAEKRGLNPTRYQIYVASSIRDAWNLKSDQLCKGLKALHSNGCIQITKSKRGKHARLILTPNKTTPNTTKP